MALPTDLYYISYFTNQCGFCKKKIHEKTDDIYMYNDTPFCIEECREKQLRVDEENRKDELKKKRVDSGPVTMLA
ncbi:hypothetical protein N665_0639s0009 [Sinapis alba]|nr:hypothetical protein N665_0639s0009 [Sinapis alba]